MPVLKMYSLPPTFPCLLVEKDERYEAINEMASLTRYPEDCNKYVMCSDGKCKLETCEPTYIFDPVTSTHRLVGPSTVSDSRGSYKLRNERFVEITCCKRIIFSS
ncbi:uncharacterized protein LOC105424584 [Pogonomyrmex barbatus]|uniref:Uncharacterized protein LOC105424584 n=1 Tax=Pogonomyrmex barbatus TaxID=144034 RepID=A0A6I9W0J9_9HYME|nr:uncharacterized protein LOC105424584 [Pogonomyrmex barbatus]